MQFINTFLVFILLFPILGSQLDSDKEKSTKEDNVSLEIVNKSNVPFNFSMKYEPRREMIKIRSEKPIKSLRIIDSEKNHRSYLVVGSDLVMIPKADFKIGEYIAEIKFQKSDGLVISKITINEEEPS